jgi:hypothetical protein
MARSFVHYRLFVGIDVAASACAVSWMRPSGQPTRAITIKQTPAGFAELQRQLLAIEPDPGYGNDSCVGGPQNITIKFLPDKGPIVAVELS